MIVNPDMLAGPGGGRGIPTGMPGSVPTLVPVGPCSIGLPVSTGLPATGTSSSRATTVKTIRVR